MAWTELTRRQHDRKGGRYASDMTDAEWSLIAPLMPPPKTTGRPRTTDLRDVFDAILYIATTGCQWRMLPNDFPPVSTVRGYFYTWRDNGLLDDMNRQLVEAARLAEGRKAQPTAGVIDSQSVKSVEENLHDRRLQDDETTIQNPSRQQAQLAYSPSQVPKRFSWLSDRAGE